MLEFLSNYWYFLVAGVIFIAVVVFWVVEIVKSKKKIGKSEIAEETEENNSEKTQEEKVEANQVKEDSVQEDQKKEKQEKKKKLSKEEQQASSPSLNCYYFL